MNSIDERLKELLWLRPNDGPRDKDICCALARSFLRLEALWMKELGISQDSSTCVDLASHLGQGDLPQHIEMKFRQSLFSRSTSEGRACRNYLRWCCLKESNPEAIQNVGIDDPFVPLVRLIEEGAEFSTEDVFFDVVPCGGINSRALRKKIWEEAD